MSVQVGKKAVAEWGTRVRVGSCRQLSGSCRQLSAAVGSVGSCRQLSAAPTYRKYDVEAEGGLPLPKDEVALLQGQVGAVAGELP